MWLRLTSWTLQCKTCCLGPSKNDPRLLWPSFSSSSPFLAVSTPRSDVYPTKSHPSWYACRPIGKPLAALPRFHLPIPGPPYGLVWRQSNPSHSP